MCVQRYAWGGDGELQHDSRAISINDGAVEGPDLEAKVIRRKSTVNAIRTRQTFWITVCILAQAMHMQSHGEIEELLHQVAGDLRVIYHLKVRQMA
jgi:hypothetical protein